MPRQGCDPSGRVDGEARPAIRPRGGWRGEPAMLTFKEIRARPVALPLERPIVARIATIKDWPLILIDLVTEEGVIGRSY